MSTEDDRKLFAEIQLQAIKSPDELIRLVDERLDTFEKIINNFPGPYDPLNGSVYIRWERKAMMWLGRVSGNLESLGWLQVMKPEVAERLKVRAHAIMNKAMEAIVMRGGRG